MSITEKQANGRPASGLLVFAEATVRGWSALVRLSNTAYRKHSAALEAAGKAAVEALAKLDFFFTSVGLLTGPEVCGGTADPSTSASRRGSARNTSSNRVPRDGCGS